MHPGGLGATDLSDVFQEPLSEEGVGEAVFAIDLVDEIAVLKPQQRLSDGPGIRHAGRFQKRGSIDTCLRVCRKRAALSSEAA